MTRRLHAVPDAPPEQKADDNPPDMSYEYLDRQRIMRRNWAETHIAADRRAALPFWTQLRRGWR